MPQFRKARVYNKKKVKKYNNSKRPYWCPHKDCSFLKHSQLKVCVGRLPELDYHDGIPNDSRLCIEADGIIDLMVNESDIYNLSRMLNILYPEEPK